MPATQYDSHKHSALDEARYSLSLLFQPEVLVVLLGIVVFILIVALAA